MAANGGVLEATSLTLPAKSAYLLYKFQKAIRSALDKVQQSEKELLKSSGIDDPEAFDKRREELSKIQDATEEERSEREMLMSQFEKFCELRKELYEEDVQLDVKAFDYDSWHALKKENNKNGRDIFSPLEPILEGILWLAPEE